MNLPPLYKKTSTGKTQVWEIAVLPSHTATGVRVEEDAILDWTPSADIVTTYGILDGKMQEARETITAGKNLGKVNATTALQQAELEAKAQWEKKLANKGYVQSLEDAESGKRDERVVGGIDPMLAHSFEKRGHDIRWPAYVQPKLDGHRCVAVIQDGVCTLWSRQRKKITGVPHINRALEKCFGTTMIGTDIPIIFDGELYNHDYRDNFEELTSFIRQQTPKPGHEVVQFWIYDSVMLDDPIFAERYINLALAEELVQFTLKSNHPIVFVPTAKVKDKDEMIRVFGAYIENGFEGLMVRNVQGKYVGKRSKDLQKVKLMQDAEYEVVAIEQGKGKMAGLAMFVCKLPDSDETFRVKMKGTLESLRDYYDNPKPWIGKMLTVQFQKFSADGKPIFPVALRFREDV